MSSSEDVWVQFGGFVAVRDSVRIEPGEFFSFLGPSGCGKTTILRTVSGFLEPSRGVVRIDGQDMAAGQAQPPPDRADLPEPSPCSH